MTDFDIHYTIDIGEGLYSVGEYQCDEAEMRKFVLNMRKEYKNAVNFLIKRVNA